MGIYSNISNSGKDNQSSTVIAKSSFFKDLSDFLSTPLVLKSSLTESELKQIESNPVVDSYNSELQSKFLTISQSLPIMNEDARYPDEVKFLLSDIQKAKLAILKSKIASSIGIDGYEINDISDLTSINRSKIRIDNHVDNAPPNVPYIMLSNSLTPSGLNNEIAAFDEKDLGPELNSLINKICNLTTATSYEDVKKVLNYDLSNIIIKSKLNPKDNKRTFSMCRCLDAKEQAPSQLQNHDDEER